MINDIFAQAQTQFSQFQAQADKFAEPARKFNELAVSNIEKLAQFNMEALRSYSDFGVDQLKQALSISDAESLQKYVASSTDAVTTVSQKLTDDARALAGISEEFTSEVQNLAKENVAILSDFVAKTKVA